MSIARAIMETYEYLHLSNFDEHIEKRIIPYAPEVTVGFFCIADVGRFN